MINNPAPSRRFADRAGASYGTRYPPSGGRSILPDSTIAFQQRAMTFAAGSASKPGFVRRSVAAEGIARRSLHVLETGHRVSRGRRGTFQVSIELAIPSLFERFIDLAQFRSIPSRQLPGGLCRRRLGISARSPLVRPRR